MSSEADNLHSAYDGVVRGELSWILLHYAYEQSDELELYCYGAEGLEELKTKFYDLEQVFVAFYREELEENPGFILINYIPASTTHVRRARALVNSRRVGVILKRHQTMLTIDNLSQLTMPLIHKALVQPESFSAPPMGASISLSSEPARSRFGSKKPKPINLDQIPRRSFSETYAPQFPVPQFVPPVPPLPSNHHKSSSGMLSGFLRRKKRDDLFNDDLPPPIPPKDDSIHLYQKPYVVPRDSPPRYLSSPPSAKRPSPTGSFSEWGVISHSNGRDVVILPMNEEPPSPPPPPPPRKHERIEAKSLPLKGKWARSPSDPKERERMRQEARKQRELEERQAVEEERKRQEEIRRRKLEEKRREEAEEIERRLRLEEELRLIAAERERKRRWEEEEEERKRRELEDRKRLDRERRLEEHRKLERWRKEREQSQAEEARRSEEAKRQEEDERRRKIQQAEKLVVQTKSVEPSIPSGWVTIQFPDSLFWKRRYYRFVGRELHLHRSEKEKDLNTTLETLSLSGTVKALKEWNDGYEELEAIPYSFVVEFKDDKGTLSLYADSEEEKFRFLGLVKHASGL